ncbi:MAG: GNAT family N-acetyltransferase [Methylocella sp.]
MNSPKLVVRRMAESELNLALDWAAAEGWNPGLHDAECFYAADPGGFFLGEFADGEPLGCVSAIAYDKHYGFLGFYMVKPQYRGRGFGLQLWDCRDGLFGRPQCRPGRRRRPARKLQEIRVQARLPQHTSSRRGRRRRTKRSA